jgi:bifunctional UDP-N-acetylglucosamine pyrophosphorylase/glucosamine-1-phosphate N-acetyltransferase
MSSLHIVILAAGKGTRMKSELPKVLHHVGGIPMIGHVLKTAGSLGPVSTVAVIGHMAETLRAALKAWPHVVTAVQEPQLGTGHALLQAEAALQAEAGSGTAAGTVVLLSGDVPLLESGTLHALVEHHRQAGAALTALTTTVESPKGYGRILRDSDGRFTRIVEERDATDEERRVREINSGIYAFELEGLFNALRQIGTGNAQGEYYLPDLVAIYRNQGRTVEAFHTTATEQLLGINSREELARMNTILRDRRNQAVMASGVTLVDPTSAWISDEVEIGRDTVIHPNVYLEGRTRIGANCEIHAGTRIVDSTLADRVIIQNYCVIRSSTVASGATLGPFAHLRPDSQLDEDVHVGNFVEVKKARLGKGTKAGHLAYLGDATIGAGVNIGAGTITCNYDGVKKHQTVIGDDVFIGSDSQLVAPVTIGAGAYVGAGSSIVEDVPAGALGIARGRQINKDGWAEEKRRQRAAAASAKQSTPADPQKLADTKK